MSSSERRRCGPSWVRRGLRGRGRDLHRLQHLGIHLHIRCSGCPVRSRAWPSRSHCCSTACRSRWSARSPNAGARSSAPPSVLVRGPIPLANLVLPALLATGWLGEIRAVPLVHAVREDPRQAMTLYQIPHLASAPSVDRLQAALGRDESTRPVFTVVGGAGTYCLRLGPVREDPGWQRSP